MKISGAQFFVSVLLFMAVFGPRANGDETAASVKSYLLKGLEKVNAASQDFVANSEAYSKLIAANGGSVEAAYKADPKKIDKLIAKMQDNYKAMDSFGYETIEGIVAGVPSMADYDIYLDAGVPASEARRMWLPWCWISETVKRSTKKARFSPTSSNQCSGAATPVG